MHSPTVPANKLQGRLQHMVNETLAPGIGTKHTAVGQLIEVYDQEKLATIAPPKELDRESSTPGLMFAKVRLVTGREMILPFKEPEDQIYLTYGNGLQLEGRRVKVEYDGLSLENGQIVIQRSYDTKLLDVAAATYAYDIGTII